MMHNAFRTIATLCALLFTQVALAIAPNSYLTFITGFTNPYEIAISPDGKYGYITNNGDSIFVIDTDDASPTFNAIIPAPNLIGLFSNPVSIAITPDGKTGYVCDAGTNSVLVINTDSSSPNFNSVIITPNLVGVFNNPSGVAITPDGAYAYVSNAGSNNLNVIDLSTNTILATPGLVGILDNPFALQVKPDGNYVYVSNIAGSVMAIDTNTNTLVATIPAVPQPEGLAFTLDGSFVYISDGGGTNFTVIDTNTASPTYNTIVSTPNLVNKLNFSNDAVITANGKYVYATNFLGANPPISDITVIDTDPTSPSYNSTLDTPALILAGTNRFFTLAVTPNARYVYAVNGFQNNVAVIYTGIIEAPANFTGCKTRNVFLLQTDYINRLSWSSPTLGVQPYAYQIYRDADLTDLVAIVPGTVFTYDDHNRKPNTDYTYYIVSADGLGNTSSAASITVTATCG